MPQFKLVVLGDAVADRQDEFNDWYDNVHLGDVLKVDGVVGAQRFELKSGGKWRYLAIYDLDCEDPAIVEKNLQALAGTDAMKMTDAFDLSTYYMASAEPITAHRTA